MSSYLGNIPSNNFVSLKRQVITGNGGASYTLDYSVASVNDVAIFVNNVRQDPASYSISGTALTLGGTISSSDSCYVLFLGQGLQTVTPANNTITNAMIQDGTIAESKLASGVNTIQEVDQWRLSTNVNNASGTNNITANLERNDTDFTLIGTGMTESSGIFSFPSTGIYLITVFSTAYNNATNAYGGIYIRLTTDNSTYNDRGYYIGAGGSAGEYQTASGNIIFDVTNTSTHKVRFAIDSPASFTLQGTTNQMYTGFTFIRLGDT